MKMRIFVISAFFIICGILSIQAQHIERVEPLCWWAGMQTNLQLMIYGENLTGSKVEVREKGLQVKAVYNAESPNYIFVDIEVEKPGTYTLEIKKNKKTITYKYEILTRREGSAERLGFTNADAIYLIMPDRFANGDTSNDRLESYTQVLDRSGLEDRHGGDIQGIIDHLDYIHDLGVTTIWCTPVLEDKSFYHQYSCTDYYKIEPHFGTNELYKDMVQIAHEKGLKVIQDAVPNHCSNLHWWIKDLPFSDWITSYETYGKSNYALSSFSDPYASQSDRDICSKGWFIDILPDMNLSNPYVMQYFSQMTIWWIEYADLDGLRVDTYFYLGKDAAIWTENIRKEYPQMGIVGEVWGNDPAVVAYWVESDNNHDGFNSHLPRVMDFPLERSMVTGFASDNEAWGGSMKAIYNTLAQDFLYKDANTSTVVFADNHDIDRIYDMLGKDLDKVKMAMTLVTTTRGLPQIYYGTELLFENDNRGGLHKMRMDFPGGWPEDKTNIFKAEDRTPQQQEMFTHVRTLLNFRKHTSVLHTGKLRHYVPIDNIYTYFRYDDTETVMVVINASNEAKEIEWKRFDEQLVGQSKGTDILTGKEISKDSHTEIEAKTSMVIHFK